MKPHPLKVERELRGWSQARVAEAVGTNVRTVIRWEQGQTLPYPYYRERLCELFGKNVRELGLLEESHQQEEDVITSTISHVEETPITAQTVQDTQSPPTSSRLWKVPPIFMPLVGRTQELDEIKTLLANEQVRLLTLIGAGGIGKTRLSVQIAHELWTLFTDGICFVALTTISDSEQVLPTIAHELGLQDESVPAYECIVRYLHDKQMLLVLDNFEQVTGAAAKLEQLLVACQRLKLLVTSRAVLHCSAEYQYRLPPLPVPNLQEASDSAAISQNAAIELFVQRARTLLPAFQVTATNAAVLAEICVRLDGIPLAIELAAARIKLLPPQSLLPRLTQSLQVLTKGPSTLPERQQTMRSTIQWSYELLDAGEQRLFRLLSIFIGGFTLEMAEALGAIFEQQSNASIPAILDGLDSLIDKSLLQPALPLSEAQEPRVLMLETIRAYGQECLQQEGEMDSVRQAHALCYLQFVEPLAQELQEQQEQWMTQLDQEHGNLQLAMEWLLTANAAAPDRQMMALRLANALGRFWLSHGYLHEGRHFFELALATAPDKNTPELARAYLQTAQIVMSEGELDSAESLLERSRTIYAQLNDTSHLAEALRLAGWVAHQKNQTTRAQQLYEQSLALYTQIDYPTGIASTLLNLAFIVQTQGDYQRARVLLEEVVTRYRALQHKRGLFGALYQLAQVLFGAEEHPPIRRIHVLLKEALNLAGESGDRAGVTSIQGLLGWVAFREGKLVEARHLMEECLRFHRTGGDRIFTGQHLILLGEIVTAQGEYTLAQTLFEESLAIERTLGSKTEIGAQALESMASLALAQNYHAWAVRLWSAAELWREEIQQPIMPGIRGAYEAQKERVRALLGEKAFASLWEEGHMLSPDEVWYARTGPLPSL